MRHRDGNNYARNHYGRRDPEWRFESEDLENGSFLLDEEVLGAPDFHDGWSPIRPRPRSTPEARATR